MPLATLSSRIAQALRVEGPHPKGPPSSLWLYAKQRGHCFHCGRFMEPRPNTGTDDTKQGYTREHVLPVSKGGTGFRNVALTHGYCNRARANKLPDGRDLFRLRMLYTGISFDFPALVSR